MFSHEIILSTKWLAIAFIILPLYLRNHVKSELNGLPNKISCIVIIQDVLHANILVKPLKSQALAHHQKIFSIFYFFFCKRCNQRNIRKTNRSNRLII